MVAKTQASGDALSRWDDVRLFLALYRERSLAAAGARAGLDASTLSRRLVALEQALGVRLFERSREGLLATAAAEQLLPAAEEMALAQARFSRDASGFERAAEGIVRLSVPPGVADAYVAPALLRLRQLHPGISIELDASVRVVDLTRREADLAIRTIRPQSGDLVMLKVAEHPWTPMIAPQLAKQHGVVKNWADLPWIAWQDDLASIPPARWLSKHVPKAPVVPRTSHIATQVAAVVAGLAVALLPLSYRHVAPTIAPVRHSKTLAASVRDLPPNETWLVGHRALRHVPRIAAVWEFLQAEFQALR